ncbi:hypothetical protein ACJJIG_10575 [Microbulbifer sp. SSSA007]|uniref:hypothetical protein n=1 Tax=Microbulbifer sp. SSSA007 TaxID=3243379 RepID=UPI0040396E7C
MRVILFVLCLASIAGDASDITYKSQFSKEQIIAFFKETYDQNTEINNQWMMDVPRHEDALIRMEMVSDQIDSGKEISYLEIYGLKKTGEGKYLIHFYENHGWVTLSDLFLPLTFPNLIQRNRLQLASRGFSKKDLGVLDIYLRSNNLSRKKQGLYLSYLISEGPRLVDIYKSNGGKYRAFITYKEEVNNQSNRLAREWCLNLYNMFYKRAKIIILSYLTDQLGQISIIKESNIGESIEVMFKGIEDGSLVAAIKKELAKGK